MERDEIWDEIKKHSQDKFDKDRKRFLAEAQRDEVKGWEKHTPFHWSRMVDGERLDYWPSRKKWQYKGRIRRGLGAMYGVIDANPAQTGSGVNSGVEN